jgi:hypothetical protein
MSMAHRLRHAREVAGYITASDAIEYFNWPDRTYRAHEIGQHNYTPTTAELYARAFGVSASWLLLGEEGPAKTKPIKASVHKHNCPENIQIATLLLQADPNNLDLINMIETCAISMRVKAAIKLGNTNPRKEFPRRRVISRRPQ